MTIQQAIEKAIEGGYNTHGWVPGEYVSHDAECITFLDPLFWKSLGAAMGWYREKPTKDLRPGWHMTHCGEKSGLRNNHWFCERCDKYEWDVDFQEMWLYHWHRFIDHLAEGKDAESFFENL